MIMLFRKELGLLLVLLALVWVVPIKAPSFLRHETNNVARHFLSEGRPHANGNGNGTLDLTRWANSPIRRNHCDPNTNFQQGRVIGVGMHKTGVSTLRMILKDLSYFPFRPINYLFNKDRLMDPITLIEFLGNNSEILEYVKNMTMRRKGMCDGMTMYFYPWAYDWDPTSLYVLTVRGPGRGMNPEVAIVNSDLKMIVRNSSDTRGARSLDALIDMKLVVYGVWIIDFGLVVARRSVVHNQMVREFFAAPEKQDRFVEVCFQNNESFAVLSAFLNANISPRQENQAPDTQVDLITAANVQFFAEWQKFNYTFINGKLISVFRDGLTPTQYYLKHYSTLPPSAVVAALDFGYDHDGNPL